MEKLSRGRGRGLDLNTPLTHKPGGLNIATPQVGEFSVLLSVIHSINPDTEEDFNEKYARLKCDIASCCINEELLNAMLKIFHERCLDDRQFGTKFAIACGVMSNFEINGVKLRALLLKMIQEDFVARSHLQSSNNNRFLNSVSFMGEVLHRVRLANGEPVYIITAALNVLLDILLGGDEHEMELFTKQLSMNGAKMEIAIPKELSTLLLHVRTTLMSRNLSGRCRTWLILALDVAAYNYRGLPPDVQEFYRIHLGSVTFSELKTDNVQIPIGHQALQRALSTDIDPIFSAALALTDKALTVHTPALHTQLSPIQISPQQQMLSPKPISAPSTPLSPTDRTLFHVPLNVNGTTEPNAGIDAEKFDTNKRLDKARGGSIESDSTKKVVALSQQDEDTFNWRTRNTDNKLREEAFTRKVDRESWGLSSDGGSAGRRNYRPGSEHDDRLEKDYEKPEPREMRRRGGNETRENWRDRRDAPELNRSNSARFGFKPQDTGHSNENYNKQVSNQPAKDDDDDDNWD